jgi:hypothetical protein
VIHKIQHFRRKNELIEELVDNVHNLLFNGYVTRDMAEEAVIAIDYMYGTNWAAFYYYD